MYFYVLMYSILALFLPYYTLLTVLIVPPNAYSMTSLLVNANTSPLSASLSMSWDDDDDRSLSNEETSAMVAS